MTNTLPTSQTTDSRLRQRSLADGMLRRWLCALRRPAGPLIVAVMVVVGEHSRVCCYALDRL